MHVLTAASASAQCFQCSFELGSACGVAVGEPCCETIKEQINGPWRLGSRGCCEGSLCHLRLPAAAEAAGEESRAERFEVGLTRQFGIEG